MSNYDRTNTGIVGKNDRKTTDTHPDITGTINIDGTEFFLDGWRKQRNDGTGSFYSLKAKRKDKQPNADSQQGGYGATKTGTGTRVLDDGDDIPFTCEFR